MGISHPVFLVLVLSFVTGVIGDAPKSPEDFGLPEYPVDDQCKRKDFIESDFVAHYLEQLGPDLDKQSVLDTLGYAVTHGIRFCTKKDILFDDIEVQTSTSYFCGRFGKNSRINPAYATSWKYLENESLDKGFNGPLEFKVTLQFVGGVNIRYFRSYIQLPIEAGNKGIFYYKMKDIQIHLTVSTDSYTTLLNRLNNQQCFLHVKSLEVSIPGASYSMEISGQKKANDLDREKISDLLKSKVDDIKEDVTSKVKAAFYEALVNSGKWVCLDDDVKELVDKKLTSTRKTITSEKFKTYCTDK